MTDIKKIFDEAMPPILPPEDFKIWAYEKSLREILDTCDREDWLLWLLSKRLGIDSRLFIYIKAKLADIIRDVLNSEELYSAVDAGILYGLENISYEEYLQSRQVSESYQKIVSLNALTYHEPDYIRYTIQSMASKWIYDDQGYSMYRSAIELLNEVDPNYPIFDITVNPMMLNIIRENTKHLN